MKLIQLSLIAFIAFTLTKIPAKSENTNWIKPVQGTISNSFENSYEFYDVFRSGSAPAENMGRFEPESLPVNFYNEYTLTEKQFLTTSRLISYSVYTHRTRRPEKSMKILNFDPRVIDFVVQYAVNSPKHFTTILEQPGFVAAINGITISFLKPQGDIKGQDLDYSGNAVNVYQVEGDESLANMRHSVGVRHNGTIEILKGGIKVLNGQPRSNQAKNPGDYKYFINGVSILFNNETFKDEKEFLKTFYNNNDRDLTKNMIPNTEAPRTALGITENDKVIIGSFGEGKFGDGYGVTTYDIYKLFKLMNVKQAVILDGGSATAMVTKKHNGYVTHPSNDHELNVSFISIFDI